MVLGGTHVLTTTWYAWEMSVGRSSYGNSPYSTAVYNSTLSSSGCQYDPVHTTNQYLPQWSPQCYTEAYNPFESCLEQHQQRPWTFCTTESAARRVDLITLVAADGGGAKALSHWFAPGDNRIRRKIPQRA